MVLDVETLGVVVCQVETWDDEKEKDITFWSAHLWGVDSDVQDEVQDIEFPTSTSAQLFAEAVARRESAILHFPRIAVAAAQTDEAWDGRIPAGCLFLDERELTEDEQRYALLLGQDGEITEEQKALAREFAEKEAAHKKLLKTTVRVSKASVAMMAYMLRLWKDTDSPLLQTELQHHGYIEFDADKAQWVFTQQAIELREVASRL